MHFFFLHQMTSFPERFSPELLVVELERLALGHPSVVNVRSLFTLETLSKTRIDMSPGTWDRDCARKQTALRSSLMSLGPAPSWFCLVGEREGWHGWTWRRSRSWTVFSRKRMEGVGEEGGGGRWPGWGCFGARPLSTVSPEPHRICTEDGKRNAPDGRRPLISPVLLYA